MSTPTRLSIDGGSRVKLSTDTLTRFRAGLTFQLQPPDAYPVLPSSSKDQKSSRTISLGGPVTAMDFHASGSWFAAATKNNQIHLFDCIKGNLSRTMNVQTAQVYTPSSLASLDDTQHQSTQPNHYINQLQFTHHATAVLYATTTFDDYNPTINYASMHDFAILQQFPGHREKVTSMVLNPCHDSFITASKDRTIRVWDLRSPKCQGLVRSPAVDHPLVAIDPMGIVLAVAAHDNCIKLFDLRQLDSGPFSTFYLTSIPFVIFHSIQFSADGSMLVVSGSPLPLSVQNKFKRRAERKYLHQDSTIDDDSDEVSDDDAYGHDSGSHGGKPSQMDDGDDNSNSDGRSPPISEKESDNPNFTQTDLNFDVVLTIDAFNGQILHKFSINRDITPLSGATLQTIGADPLMVELTKYIEQHGDPTQDQPHQQTPSSKKKYMGPNSYAIPTSLSADGKYLALGSKVGTIPFYDARNGKSVTTFTHRFQQPIRHVKWNPSRSIMVSADDKELVFWVQSAK